MESLYKKLVSYGNSDYYPFHMPGHKRNAALIGANLPYEIDITEIDGFDDLHHAEGILKDLQEYAADVYHAEETHYLVNGSTVGLLSAVMGNTRAGDWILMARNCHKSVYHAVEMNGLHPIYIYPEKLNIGDKCSFGQELNGEASPEEIERLLEEYPKIKAVVITSPTYDGVVSDVRRIAGIVHKKGIPLIVDEAHGAHFGFHPYFPMNSSELGADLVIHSLHKTLPSLTQTALLHMNGTLADRENVREYLHMLQSSSPSYVLMAGIDECIRFVGDRETPVFAQYAKRLQSVRERLKSLSELQLVESERYDRSKIVIAVKNKEINKFTGKQLYNELKDKYLLQPEMAAGSYVVLMTSLADTEEGLERLVLALKEIDRKLAKIGKSERNNSLLQDIDAHGDICKNILWKEEKQRNTYVYNPGDAKRLRREERCESVGWEKCSRRISGEYAYLYPPGIPLIVPGERISEKTAERIKEYEEMGFQIEGTKKKGKIEVLING